MVNVYSNSASRYINIDIVSDNTDLAQVVIHDINGKQVEAFTKVVGKGHTMYSHTLKLAMVAGTYVVNVFKSGKQHVYKIQVQ